TSDTEPTSSQSVQLEANSALSVSCAGTSLTVTGNGPTSATLECLAAQAIAQVGQATTFASGNSGTPTTDLPDGTSAGDVLVSYVESYSFTSISCDSGWTQVLDVSNGTGAQLVACVTVATLNQSNPQAQLSAPTQVSM